MSQDVNCWFSGGTGDAIPGNIDQHLPTDLRNGGYFVDFKVAGGDRLNLLEGPKNQRMDPWFRPFSEEQLSGFCWLGSMCSFRKAGQYVPLHVPRHPPTCRHVRFDGLG